MLWKETKYKGKGRIWRNNTKDDSNKIYKYKVT